MQVLKSARNRNAQQIPILEYDYANGVRVQATSAAASFSDVLDAGSYLITSSAPVWLSAHQEAGDLAGAIYLAAGMPFHQMMSGGAFSVRAVDEDATVMIVPAV